MTTPAPAVRPNAGPRAASRWAAASERPASSAAGTASSARPRASAWPAPKVAPFRDSGRACASPARSRSSSSATAGNGTPTSSSVTPARPGPSAMTAQSAAADRMNPPAIACPLTAATTGSSKVARRVKARRSSGRKAATYPSRPAVTRLRSTPAENTGPAPVSTTAGPPATPAD